MSRVRTGWVVLGVLAVAWLAISATHVLAPNTVPEPNWMLASAAPPPLRPVFVQGAGAADHGPRKTKDVPPVYPEDAKQARVEGLVILEIDIDDQGHVSDARIMKSVPMLDQAALDAVAQWEYDPAVANGTAVPVKLTVTVNFTLKKDSPQ